MHVPFLSEAVLKSQSYNEYIFRKFYLDYNWNVLEVTDIGGRDIYVVFPIVWTAPSHLALVIPYRFAKHMAQVGK